MWPRFDFDGYNVDIADVIFDRQELYNQAFVREASKIDASLMLTGIPANSVLAYGGRGNALLAVFPPVFTNKENKHSTNCVGCGAPPIGYEVSCRYCDRRLV